LESFLAGSALLFAAGPFASVPQPVSIAPSNLFSPVLFSRFFGAAAAKGGFCIK
jgi:hypothetical protein